MDATPRLTREDKRTLGLSSLGGALEFYDFVIYVFYAKIISELFFPAGLSPFWADLCTFTELDIVGIDYCLNFNLPNQLTAFACLWSGGHHDHVVRHLIDCGIYSLYMEMEHAKIGAADYSIPCFRFGLGERDLT